ncbi:MAG TPA: MBL fold metallo-hydrolase [Thermoanaerobaculia bacterium]|nr:MBL fold metallo-hydrolase [Thermoanaerobaculia bacterium]
MRRIVLLLALAVAFLPVRGRASAAQPGRSNPHENFTVQKIAEGVYAVIRSDPPGLMVDGNCVLIVNDEDVVVVDAPEASREILAALRKITTKPVRYVVNTHWHDDHVLGNRIWRDAFPGVEFIAHENTRAYLPGQGLVNRRTMLQGAPPFVAHMKDLLAQNKSFSGAEMTPEERTSFASDIALVDQYLAEVPSIPIVLPTVGVTDRVRLYRGERTIEILSLGSGHTAGDIVVNLPKERIAITGDLVVYPVPFVGDPQSHVSEWAPTLAKLRALSPAMYVPGHGPVLRDDSYVRLLEDLFGSIDRQTRAAAAAGRSLEEARKAVDLEELRRRFAGDSRVRDTLFRNYVAGPAVAAAFREATAPPAPARQ